MNSLREMFNLNFQRRLHITQKETVNFFATRQLSIFAIIEYHSELICYLICFTAFSDLYYLLLWQTYFRHFSSGIELWKAIDYWGTVSQLHSSTIFWPSKENDLNLQIMKSIFLVFHYVNHPWRVIKVRKWLQKAWNHFTWDRVSTKTDHLKQKNVYFIHLTKIKSILLKKLLSLKVLTLCLTYVSITH